MRGFLCLLSGLGLVVLAAESRGEEHDPRPARIERIDRHLAKRWQEQGIEPAPRADDATFVRRAYLDLTGVIPQAGEARAFAADTAADKDARLIDRLLTRSSHARHLANLWRRMLLPGEADVQAAGGSAGFEAWLREQFSANQRYDNLVADLLMARGNARQNGPALYYAALELKPEQVAASTARNLLGVQIECAQCHNHPFDRWTKADFWGYAAFFARLQRSEMRRDRLVVNDADGGELRLPDSDQVVLPRYLGGQDAPLDQDANRRRQLTLWLVSRENPFFAKATVNRAWSLLFGRGLVEPVDDFSERNPPSHPLLLDELAADFVESGYDLRELLRSLCLSRLYRTSSGATETPPELFAQMLTKTLTPEQLFDSMLEATHRRTAHQARLRAQGLDPTQDPQRQEFFNRVSTPRTTAAEYQSGIPQSLTLMNGSFMHEATAPDRSPLLTALEAPFLTNEQRVDALFLATLARPPHPEEQAPFLAHLANAPPEQRRMALGDLLWALLNSGEFALNR